VTDSNEQQQRNYREFLDLIPLTIEIAGLPRSEPGRYYSEDQLESRLITLRHAYRFSRQVARECIQK
tara:strand:+ start:344 stop:544 length:201 start_codon:yes stop_codon:yes gene_type:complete